jgi:hypothetical protein
VLVLGLTAILLAGGCAEMREIIDDPVSTTGPTDQLLFADFLDGPEPFQDAIRPNFTAEADGGLYRFRIEGVARSFAPLTAASNEVTVLVDLLGIGGPGATQAAIGVGCTGDSGEGYTFVVETSGRAVLVWDSPEGEFEFLTVDDTFVLPSPGDIRQLAISCTAERNSGETTVAAALNGDEVMREIHRDGLIEFTTTGLVFHAGPEPWEVAIDTVDAHRPRAGDPFGQ